MRIPRPRLILCLAAAGLLTGCATSASTSASSSSSGRISAVDKNFMSGIGSYDANRDGIVTCDEWRAAMTAMFTKADKKAAGFLTDAEFQTLALTDRTFLAANVKYYDANNDGKVDKKEFVDRPNPAFTYGDKDQDCKLSEPEVAAVRNSATPREEPLKRSTVATGSPGLPGNSY